VLKVRQTPLVLVYTNVAQSRIRKVLKVSSISLTDKFSYQSQPDSGSVLFWEAGSGSALSEKLDPEHNPLQAGSGPYQSEKGGTLGAV
jgi:hypothetical protein